METVKTDKIIEFRGLKFAVTDGDIRLIKCKSLTEIKDVELAFIPALSEVNIAGDNRNTHLGNKLIRSSEWAKLKFSEVLQSDNRLVITQKSDKLAVKTIYECFDGCNALRIHTEAENISDSAVTLEEVSSAVVCGFGKKGVKSADNLFFYPFYNSHWAECQPKRLRFTDLGVFDDGSENQKSINFTNIGSWSTKERLPQAIVEDEKNGSFTMFQIESNNTWHYEISDSKGVLYLLTCGGDFINDGWCKLLEKGQTYTTVSTILTFGKSYSEVTAQMAKYRRNVSGKCAPDKNLPAIFNEYMHLSWDSPSETTSKRYAEFAKRAGAKYYVIDCGWHDEVPGNIIYPYVGEWKEGLSKFPNGVRHTTDYIRSLGMKAGLWIEPEIVGCECRKMIDYYGEDCFLCRNGKPIITMGRLFLDFRNPKVVDYMSETIRRMAEDYGADYIKFDYNQDCGQGTELLSDSLAEGLEQAAAAYLKWADSMTKKFSNVLFETCSSGGMRMDYQTLSHFSIVSTSDQVFYNKYPYIAGNILAAVLPEQAAVWSYPVGTWSGVHSKEWVCKNITEEIVIMNMINSFLGRMHLASNLDLLSDNCFALVKEGVECYDSLTAAKKSALPYFPLGYTSFGDKTVAAGFTSGGKLYLAVWNLGGERNVNIPLDKAYSSVKCIYPKSNRVKYAYADKALSITFTKNEQARFFELK